MISQPVTDHTLSMLNDQASNRTDSGNDSDAIMADERSVHVIAPKQSSNTRPMCSIDSETPGKGRSSGGKMF